MSQETAVDVERLRKAIDLSGIGIAEGGHPASEWTAAIAREYDLIGLAPKEDWQCATPGCYLHAGHASEHEPGMCECGSDMEGHSGGWTLLHHDQFMERFRAAAIPSPDAGEPLRTCAKRLAAYLDHRIGCDATWKNGARRKFPDQGECQCGLSDLLGVPPESGT